MTKASASTLDQEGFLSGLDDLGALRRFARTGDPRAFEVLVVRYQQMVFSTCRRALGNATEAEDAAQDTFLKLAQNAGRVRSNTAAWLHSCAMRCSIDALRRRGARDRAERRAAEAPSAEHDDIRLWASIEPRLDDALAALSDKERGLLVARFLAGRSQAELAQEAGVNAGTIHRRIDRALSRLRSHVGDSDSALAPATTATTAVIAGALVYGLGRAATPDTLHASLMKISLIGPKGAAANSLGFGTLFAGPGAKIAVGVAGAALLGSGAWYASSSLGVGASSSNASGAAAVAATGTATRDRANELPEGRFVVRGILINGEPGSTLTLRGNELRVRFQPDERGRRHELSFRVLEREETDDGAILRATLERSTLAKPNAYSHLVGETMRIEATIERGFVSFVADRNVTTSWGADAPLTWTGARPVDIDNGADAIEGEWHEAMILDVDVDDPMITITHKGMKAYAYRVLAREPAGDAVRLQTICTDSWDPSLVGKRVKLLVRDDGNGFSLATHQSGSVKLNEYPKNFEGRPGSGLQVYRWRRAR
ncbi:MAG: sigma-70 family RNA polymerase sigma factor [Planctomycetota bacterium]